ncbi:hypothetical protein [Natronoarchaeum rubrum]|uniref:hypothetical protein n=1 Tax=Natronoarchaeum rubrum TaxID=755311 RepID=UPI0021110A3A|nr:hypothetical protein [Natronoarchaeum rubrum]
MDLESEPKRSLVVLLYGFVLFSTSTTVAPDPTGVLSLLNLGPGLAVLVHASWRNRLWELGYAICGYVATGIGLIGAAIGLGYAGIDLGIPTELAMAVFLTAALIVLYAASLRYFDAAQPAAA